MDEDDHKRHEVPDGIQQHESHYLACKVSTLDHSWAAHEAGKQETSREHIVRDCIGRSKNCCRYPFSSLKAKSCSKGWFPFAPEVLTRINYPEVNGGRAWTNTPSLKNMFSFKHLRNLTWLYWKAKFVLLYWIMDLIRLYSRRPESNVWIYAVLKRHLAASSFQGICGEWDTQLLLHSEAEIAVIFTGPGAQFSLGSLRRTTLSIITQAACPASAIPTDTSVLIHFII